MTDTPAFSAPDALVGSPPTAAMLLIGNELLSGRTRDANLAPVGQALAARGIRLIEARVIADIESAIVDAVNTLRARYTYVFTSGGIGPTHDDITAECIARAFGVDLPVNADAKALLMDFWKRRDITPNAARLRMARIPSGASLIPNGVSAAPGFRMDNVFVMAGVPSIMADMFSHVLPLLERGPQVHMISVGCDLGEGTVAAALASLQQRFPAVDLGSYPGDYTGAADRRSRLALVARGTDRAMLAEVENALKTLVTSLGGQVSDGQSDSPP